jgi:LPXTG-motif cell wall-anchored protein
MKQEFSAILGLFAAPATLPQTGSAAPRMALAGLALTGFGLLVARKTR